eukprot:tig00021179_g19294.t1
MFYLSRSASALRPLEIEAERELMAAPRPREPSVHGGTALYAPSFSRQFPSCSGHASVVRGRQIIVLGGSAGSLLESCPVICFDTEREAWMRPHCIGIGPKLSPTGASATLVGSRVWLIGGKPDEGDGPISVYALDVSCQDTYLWRRVQTFGEVPSARYRHAACRVGEHEIWVVGGVSVSSSVFGGETSHPDIFRLDTRTRVWMRLCTTGEKLRPLSDLSAACIGKLVVLFGGRVDGNSVSAVRTVQTEHPHEVCTVPFTGAEPERRSFHAAAAVGGSLVVAGGRNGSTGLLPDAAVFHLASRSWTAVPLSADERRLLCRSSHTASPVGSRVWLLGGEGLLPSAAHDNLPCPVVALHTGLKAGYETAGGEADGDPEEADLWRSLVPVFNDDPAGPPPLASPRLASPARADLTPFGAPRRDVPFEFALRYLFSLFRPPGEAQLVERVLDAFAERYFSDNPQSRIFSSAASVSSLAYSVLMLNTSRHNPAVRPSDRMNHKSFVHAVRDPRIPGGLHFPDAFLEALYYSIKKDSIRLQSQPGSARGGRRPSTPESGFGPGPGSASSSRSPSPTLSEGSAWNFSDRTRAQQARPAGEGVTDRRAVGVGPGPAVPPAHAQARSAAPGPAQGPEATPEPLPDASPPSPVSMGRVGPAPSDDSEPLMGPVSRSVPPFSSSSSAAAGASSGQAPRAGALHRLRKSPLSPASPFRAAPCDSFRSPGPPPVTASPPRDSPASSRSASPPGGEDDDDPAHPTLRLLDPEARVPTAAVLRPLATRASAAAAAAASASRTLAFILPPGAPPASKKTPYPSTSPPPDDVLEAADRLRDALKDPQLAQGRGAELAAAAYRVSAHAGRSAGPVPPGRLAAECYQNWRVDFYSDVAAAVDRLEAAARALEGALAQASGGGPELTRLAAAAAAAVPSWGPRPAPAPAGPAPSLL